MTRAERAAVVELLRCAADLWNVNGNGIGVASVFLESGNMRWCCAVEAWDATAGNGEGLAGWTYADVCLEAAQRVEEGSWP